MLQREYFGYTVAVDEAATREWYAASPGWGCECGDCRRFLALAQQRALPQPLLDTLDALGIAPHQATYVCELYTDEQGAHYQFSYRLAGEILAAPTDTQAAGRCCHEPYPYGAPGFPTPHFD
ncbi:MAG: hypothetical protein IJC70_06715, partial [Firmicutes bacterium]|nr:hypothetical protein [Bacillota bacterium]